MTKIEFTVKSSVVLTTINNYMFTKHSYEVEQVKLAVVVQKMLTESLQNQNLTYIFLYIQFCDANVQCSQESVEDKWNQALPSM